MRGSETTNWKVYLMSGTWHLAVIGSPTTAGSQCSFSTPSGLGLLAFLASPRRRER